MTLNLVGPDEHELRARITVFGVGGAGGNAVNNMIEKALEGVDFIAANTDAQALANSRAPRSIQLGTGVTRGLGAGSKPEVGMRAAEETIEEVASHLDGANMCFITAGMGGGTGTGAAPIVAKIAREMGILTVGVVTKPFHFEGSRRMSVAEAGLAEMQSVVDTLIVIPNQNLFQVASERTTFVEAFQMADDVLYQGVQGVTDLMVRPGMINLDFADVRSVMEEMGKAMMGTGEAEGETRAIDAAEKAIANPLLDEVSLKGARGVLINITGGYDLTLFEMDEAANRIKEEVDPNAMIKFGSAIDPDLEGKMRVSVVATGIDADAAMARPPAEAPLRRRPAETDPDIVTAVRGQRRPEPSIEAPSSVVAASEATVDTAVAETPEAAAPVDDIWADAAQAAPEPFEAAKMETPTVATATVEPATAEAEADEIVAELEELPQEPATIPAAAPRTSEQRIVGRSDDSRFATAPAPSDIRARAEEVRQRALAARAARDDARRTAAPVVEEEPALFDLDDASLEAAAPSPEQDAAQPTGVRSGLFTINKLIHRVAGNADPEAAPGGERREPTAMDDENGEIPAFLRRQAN
ncbi:MAG: cell division protein FtsZ [Pseudomonadota bacterium]